jgi:hypothetical protein
MYNVFGMHIYQGRRDRSHNARGLFFRESSLLNDIIKEFSALHELHDNKNLFLRYIDVVKSNNVGMVQLAKRLNFGMKLVHHALKAVFNVMFVNDFARVG